MSIVKFCYLNCFQMAPDLVPRSSLGEEYVRMDGVMVKASYQEVINRIQNMEVTMVSAIQPPKKSFSGE